MRDLALQVISPEGVVLDASHVEKVVLRRRESGHVAGSEVAVHPSHAPMLVQTPPFLLRWEQGGDESTLDVGQGVAEVYEDRVTVLVSGVRSTEIA